MINIKYIIVYFNTIGFFYTHFCCVCFTTYLEACLWIQGFYIIKSIENTVQRFCMQERQL